jgi:hypothetical protein
VLPFFREHYQRTDDRWRKVDNDWPHTAEQITLLLHDQTKNTSLALAIELEPDGRVLLFPGDAHGENWSSWGVHRWRRAPPPVRPVTAADLLSRTVLYKVGNHGSHRATLRERGLELMTSRELTAMLPVCRETATRMCWQVPFAALVEELRRKTRGRLILSDERVPARPDYISEPEWGAFVQRVKVSADGRYIDYLV